MSRGEAALYAGRGRARGLPRRGGTTISRLTGDRRILRGRAAQIRGIDAEAIACAALESEGWRVLARRLRTRAGEVDAVAERNGLLAFVEVKARPDLTRAAWALSTKQRARLLGAAEIVLAEHPEWGRAGVRFDVLLVDAGGRVRRIADAFRQES